MTPLVLCSHIDLPRRQSSYGAVAPKAPISPPGARGRASPVLPRWFSAVLFPVQAGELLGLERADEIGILGREFDSMLEKLARSRATVVKTARRAGMSEIATGILHNVGNVLNSVNVSASMVSDRVKNSKITKLERLSTMVEKHGDALGELITNNPKGKHVGPYITEVTNLMRVEQETVLQELGELEKGIEHIRQLVNSQQDYAGQNDLRELADLAEQFEQALTLSERASPDGVRVEVEREFDELPRVAVDRHKLAEVLVNLITNARQALERGRVATPRLNVSRALEESEPRCLPFESRSPNPESA